MIIYKDNKLEKEAIQRFATGGPVPVKRIPTKTMPIIGAPVKPFTFRSQVDPNKQYNGYTTIADRQEARSNFIRSNNKSLPKKDLDFVVFCKP